MKVTTIVFASAVVLSAIAPALAEEDDLLRERAGQSWTAYASEHRPVGRRATPHHPTDARAYAPADARAFAPAYAPSYAPSRAPYDFGIGSQS